MSQNRTTELLEAINGRSFRTIATGAAALSVNVTHTDHAFLLKEFRIHLSAAGTAGNLVVSINSGLGAAYDVVLLTQDMTAVVDLVYVFDRSIDLQYGDVVNFVWANASTRTYGLEVLTACI